MDLVGGFVAPEDLVVATDGFGGEHQPIGVGIARVGTPGRGDVEGGGALEYHRLAVAAAVQEGVAFRFDLAVIVENRTHHRSGGADAVASSCSQGKLDGFVRFDRGIGRRIHRDDRGGRTSGKADRLGGWRGRDTGVIRAEAGSAVYSVIHNQPSIDRPSSGKDEK